MTRLGAWLGGVIAVIATATCVLVAQIPAGDTAQGPGSVPGGAPDKQAVPYPQGFRSWTVVKSVIVGPDHETFAKRGGLHHYYANEAAVTGYRGGSFPDGSIVVDEAVFLKDGEGRAKGLTFEGVRRSLDVMMKDSRRYPSTGGWGYEHYERDDTTGRLSGADQANCSACHSNSPTDHVFSRIRP